MQPNEKTVQIAFKGSEAYRKQIQLAATERDMKVQQFLENAVELYLHQADGLLPKRDNSIQANPLWEDVQSVLSSGNTTAIALLKTSLKAAVELCTLSRAQDLPDSQAEASDDYAEAVADAENVANEARAALAAGCAIIPYCISRALHHIAQR